MKNPGVNDLKKYLNTMSQKELEEEIVNLFKTFPAVKEFYSSRLNPASDAEILEKYKKKITKEFLPVGNSFSLKYKNCRDAIKEFQKVCENKRMAAELMFHYADEGIGFTEDYGDIDEQFVVLF